MENIYLCNGRFQVLLLFIGLAAFAGCGSGGKDTVAVTGRVTVGGQPAPAGGEIIYTPTDIAPGSSVRPAMANIDEDGYFEASSFSKGDGLMPGTYNVTIQCWQRRPTGLSDPGVSAMPNGFKPPQLVVSADGPRQIETNYEIPGK